MVTVQPICFCQNVYSGRVRRFLLFHSDEVAAHKIKAMLEEDGVQGLTLQYPEKAYV